MLTSGASNRGLQITEIELGEYGGRGRIEILATSQLFDFAPGAAIGRQI
jgi:hypothetical protein